MDSEEGDQFIAGVTVVAFGGHVYSGCVTRGADDGDGMGSVVLVGWAAHRIGHGDEGKMRYDDDSVVITAAAAVSSSLEHL